MLHEHHAAFGDLTVSPAAATSHCMETIQSNAAPGPRRRRAERPLGLSRAAAPAVALCAACALGPADRLAAAAVAVLVVGGACGERLCASPASRCASLLPSPWHLVLFLIGAIAMRGAGCTYNDIVDEDIDEQVERTRSRPLPSGQVTRRQAWAFLVGCRRWSGWPCCCSSTGFADPARHRVAGRRRRLSVHEALHQLAATRARPCLFLGRADGLGGGLRRARHAPPLLLYIGSILWVIGYDTIYAHQDKEDDALVGVRSTARLFGEQHKALADRALWRRAGLLRRRLRQRRVPMPALAGLLAAGAHMARQIRTLDIDDPDQCLRLFKSNTVVGWLIFLGLLGGGLWVALKPYV